MYMDKVILTDCDGVLLNWEYAFNTWMARHGHVLQEGYQFKYDMGQRYGIPRNIAKELIKYFNESSAIGFLPPLRDAIHYVRMLHEKHGFVFHAITSLSKEPTACELRTQNLKKLFGETVFEKFVYLDTGEDKDEALAAYGGRKHLWIEDKPENVIAGVNVGMEGILMEHGHNMDEQIDGVFIAKNWAEIYEHLGRKGYLE
jgi:FMN phosphatase YigB (HAD superfamily)